MTGLQIHASQRRRQSRSGKTQMTQSNDSKSKQQKRLESLYFGQKMTRDSE